MRAKPRRFNPCQLAGSAARASSAASPIPQIRSTGLASTNTRGDVPRRNPASSGCLPNLARFPATTTANRSTSHTPGSKPRTWAPSFFASAAVADSRTRPAASWSSNSSGLAPHHPMLGRGKTPPVNLELSRPPLRQTAGPDRSIATRAMTPEEQELRSRPARDGGAHLSTDSVSMPGVFPARPRTSLELHNPGDPGCQRGNTPGARPKLRSRQPSGREHGPPAQTGTRRCEWLRVPPPPLHLLCDRARPPPRAAPLLPTAEIGPGQPHTPRYLQPRPAPAAQRA